MNILAIETSCDETAAAVVKNGRTILSNVISSQIQEHKLYGGVVPEIASRRHVETISEVVKNAISDALIDFKEIDAIAVSYTPGLLGTLIVGVNFAKGISLALKKPLIPVHHLKGHISANYLTHEGLKPPFLALVISGGNTVIVKVLSYTDFEIVGETRDDAAGEAFDKVGRILGFSYPAGKEIDRVSEFGDDNKYNFKKPEFKDAPFDFSFSGIKTAVLNQHNNSKQKGEEINIPNLAASFQRTVSEMLTEKTFKALEENEFKKLVLAGGVSANGRIRRDFQKIALEKGIKLYLPDIKLCGDNAAMIASQGYFEYQEGSIDTLDLDAVATMDIDVKCRD